MAGLFAPRANHSLWHDFFTLTSEGDFQKRNSDRGDESPFEGQHLGERIFEAAVEAELVSGRRESTVQAAQAHVLIRAARIGAGSVVVLAGMFMLAVPGPGMVTIAIGLAILARDVPWAERTLQRVRKRLPEDADGNLPRRVIVNIVVVTLVTVGGSIAFAIWR